MLFIALLVFYLVVWLVETKRLYLSLNDGSHIHSYIKRHEVLSFHTVSQQTATDFLDVKSKTSKTESMTLTLSSHQKDDNARNRHFVNKGNNKITKLRTIL
jgi:hypothetical protein